MVGAVGQSLAYTGASFASAALAGNQLSLNMPDILRKAITNGDSFPVPNAPVSSQSATPGTVSYNSDSTVNATDLNGYPQGSM